MIMEDSETADDEEKQSCILTPTILSLRNHKTGGGGGIHDLEDVVMSHHSDSDSNSDSDSDAFLCRLPDAIIQHGILSYRPFVSIRVVLIRCNTNNNTNKNEQDCHQRNHDNRDHNSNSNSNSNNNKYTLVFRTNRGPIRFRVTEIPYLPDTADKQRNKDDDTIRKNAPDGVILSCYRRRFHDYCNRCESTNSLFTTTTTTDTNDSQNNSNNTVTATFVTTTGTRADKERREEEDIGGRTTTAGRKKNVLLVRNKRPPLLRTVVLCGNDIDVTDIDTKYSSVVLSTSTTSTTKSTNTSSKCHTFTDTPRHPFASLARKVTNDNDLIFISLL